MKLNARVHRRAAAQHGVQVGAVDGRVGRTIALHGGLLVNQFAGRPGQLTAVRRDVPLQLYDAFVHDRQALLQPLGAGTGGAKQFLRDIVATPLHRGQLTREFVPLGLQRVHVGRIERLQAEGGRVETGGDADRLLRNRGQSGGRRRGGGLQ